MDKPTKKSVRTEGVSRRDFIKTSAAAGAASVLLGSGRVYAQGSDTIRVGLIGCGGRGTGAGIIDCAASSKGIELVALGDLFQDHIDTAPDRIKKNLARRDLPVDQIYKVTPDRMFVGFDAHKKVIESGVDMIILTTPPFFRPQHFKAAVEAGVHVFAEKPIAVDPVGVRDFIETSKKAKEKGLTVGVGTQMRRARQIMAAVEKIREGALGDIVGGQCVRRGDAMLDWYADTKQQKPEWSDMEWQIRRWLFITWLSGDFIVEQHVHNLDLVNWALGSPPLECVGMGARQVRTAPEHGNIYDQFSAEFLYPNDVRIGYMGCQIDGVSGRCDQRLAGTKGHLMFDFGTARIEGENPWKYDGPTPDPAVEEYADAIASIRENKKNNEGIQVAESTLTAIMARTCAYTGNAMKWDWLMNASKLDLSPAKLEFGPLPMEPVAMPGVTKLV